MKNGSRSEATLRRMYTAASKLPDGRERLSKMMSIALSICWHGETWSKAKAECDRLMELGYRSI